MAKASTAVATADDTNNVPAVYDYGAEAGEGYEGLSGSDFSIPFLTILQGLSPQVAEGTVEGARPGQLFNTVTNELVDGNKGIVFQCVELHKKYVEWVPREQGGGLVGTYDPGDPEVTEAIDYSAAQKLDYGKLVTRGGNTLQETYYAYGLILEDDGQTSKGFAVISFKSTNIKPMKNWATVMRTTQKGKIPMRAFRTVIKTVAEKHKKGTAFNFSFTPFGGKTWVDTLLPPGSALMNEGKDFREMVISGKAKADLSQGGSTTSTEAAGVDKEIPF